jgi:Insertion element 4 transposase N-terminal/Transposase DDE domain
MARFAKKITNGDDSTQHLSVGVLSLCFPIHKIQEILLSSQRASKRVRDLPAAVTVYYVIAMALFPSAGYQSVLGWLLAGLQWLGSEFRLSGKSALSAARSRLGAASMQLMHAAFARPLAEPELKGSYWKGLQLVALDGCLLALQDTKENEAAFGRSSNQNGASAYPMARFVALVEVGTHLIFGAALGGYKDSEITLAKQLTSQLTKGMVCLADRLYPGYHLWKMATAGGAHLIWRAKAGAKLKRIKTLADGSWLTRYYPSKGARKLENSVIVRVVEYRLKGAATDEAVGQETYRLMTSILDPSEASAEEIASVYPQRWDIELSLKEGKAVLRGDKITLRSKTAELVRQEFWGVLLAHYVVRKMMALAALKRGQDPDDLSYKESIEIIKARLTAPTRSVSP